VGLLLCSRDVTGGGQEEQKEDTGADGITCHCTPPGWAAERADAGSVPGPAGLSWSARVTGHRHGGDGGRRPPCPRRLSAYRSVGARTDSSATPPPRLRACSTRAGTRDADPDIAPYPGTDSRASP